MKAFAFKVVAEGLTVRLTAAHSIITRSCGRMKWDIEKIRVAKSVEAC